MKIDTVRIWAWHVALTVSLLVFILSLKVEISFLFSVFRAILGFALIYGISEMGLVIFEKTGLPMEAEALGAFLDIAVGQNEEVASTSEEVSTSIEEQKIDKAIAGQVNQELTQGPPDAEKQAEIIRRMGWGDD